MTRRRPNAPPFIELVFLLLGMMLLATSQTKCRPAFGATVEKYAAPGTQIWLNGKVAATVGPVGSEPTVIGLPESVGDDIRIIPKAAAVVTPPPATQPTPIIPGKRIPSGGKIPNSGTVLLERGAVYSAALAPESYASYLAVGDATKDLPVINGRVEFNGKTNVVFNGIDLRGAGKPGVVGFSVFNSTKVQFLNGRVTGFGANGINVQGYGGKRCSDVQIRGSLIANNWPADASKHCQGVYSQATDRLTVDGCVIAENGGVPGVGTQFNQGLYAHASCTPPTITNNVFYKNAAHGLQQRPGGPNHGNVFIDNPVGMSYGLVNRELCYPGGVSGIVENNVYIGGGAVAGGPNAGRRGWALELSNAKSVTVRNILVAHDNQNASKAIHVDNCVGLENPGAMLAPAKWSILLQNCYVYDWAPGAIEVKAGAPTRINAGVAPPKTPNLRAAIGGDAFMPWARANPSVAAATAIAKCFAAAGVN